MSMKVVDKSEENCYAGYTIIILLLLRQRDGRQELLQKKKENHFNITISIVVSETHIHTQGKENTR